MQLVFRKAVSSHRLALAIAATGLLVLQPTARGQGGQQGQARQQAASPPQAAAAPEGNTETGKKLWNTVGCYQCHGYSGQGGPAGPRLAPYPVQFDVFVAYCRKPTGQMPPYTSKVLSDTQLADIYAFLKAVPEPPDPKDIPLLNQN